MADRIRGRRAGTPPAAAEGRTPDGPDGPDGAAADADAAAASGPPDYAVGYGRPPTHTRFRKGRSGNPAGRPRGSRSLPALVAAELDRPVAVREGGAVRRMRKRQALAASLVNKALQGDGRALMLAGRPAGPRGTGRPRPGTGRISAARAEDREIIEAFLARDTGGRAMAKANEPAWSGAGPDLLRADPAHRPAELRAQGLRRRSTPATATCTAGTSRRSATNWRCCAAGRAGGWSSTCRRAR